VSGGCPPIVPRISTPIQRSLARYYEGFFRELERPGRTPEPGDLVGGNFSIRVEDFERAGGFDESLRMRDDFELGARLLSRGVALEYCPAARARMHMLPTGDAIVRRAEARGRNDVRLARHLPAFRHTLPFHRIFARASTRFRWRVLWSTGGIAVAVFSTLRRFAPENLRLINFEYAARYVVGLRRETGDWKTFRRLARTGSA
jgi:GT2 family glycosyltransferase